MSGLIKNEPNLTRVYGFILERKYLQGKLLGAGYSIYWKLILFWKSFIYFFKTKIENYNAIPMYYCT